MNFMKFFGVLIFGLLLGGGAIYWCFKPWIDNKHYYDDLDAYMINDLKLDNPSLNEVMTEIKRQLKLKGYTIDVLYGSDSVMKRTVPRYFQTSYKGSGFIDNTAEVFGVKWRFVENDLIILYENTH